VEIVHRLRGIQDGHLAGIGEKAILSVPDDVARAISERYLEADGSHAVEQLVLPIVGACPECGGELAHESGCVVCTAGGCGFSRCS
jgi:ribonucleoside-diphosphate reductase alpha chain